MKKKEMTDEEKEEELDKAFKANEAKRNVFSVLKKEENSEDIREKRIKKDFKFKNE